VLATGTSSKWQNPTVSSSLRGHSLNLLPRLAEGLHKGTAHQRLSEKRRSWHLPENTTVTDFISFLAKHGDLRTNRLSSKIYGRQIIRYSWGKVSILELAISISTRGCLCHATALMLHGLVKSKPKAIYLNVEQIVKQSNGGSLTQQGIRKSTTVQT
jgi:hypothetical protein